MNFNPKTGMILGYLFLFQFVLGVLINFYLLGPVIFDNDFLTLTASHETEIVTATLLAVLLGCISLWIAITLKPFFDTYSRRLGMLYLVLTVVSFAATLIDNTVLLSLLSISSDYVEADIASQAYLKSSGTLFLEVRGWIHMMDMLVGGLSIMVLYYGFCKTELVPSLFSILGCLAAITMLSNVLWSLYDSGLMILYLPIGLLQIAISFWLIIKGFNLGKLISIER